ncbi:YtcA family lipoprotein [Devosia sp. FKR38]|uniref:YtcA family lipoprotein n=1 Tax=Devosia sp. FKR38 TaxID=2562312 RepID=UPI0020BDCAAF|nr:YtcA family lipoprotein [Devosia sp. FKR38]
MKRRFSLPAMAAVLPGLMACSPVEGAPSVPLFGSFFPAWIICAVGGVIVAIVLRAVLVALRLDEHLPAPPLVYLCLAISGGIVLWLVWSGAL